MMESVVESCRVMLLNHRGDGGVKITLGDAWES